ncbi:MAG: D-2-hydroxyacid dehydrogenase [Clostridia bacterium]|nr:D-2-hydroxyacid dehydrogenase [Clostridia bacterium]
MNENKWKLCITKPFPPEAAERFSDFENINLYCGDPAEADIVMGQPSVEEIKRCKNLKWLQITSAGADQYARHPEVFGDRIKLTTVSGAFGQSISEWTLALTLSLYKHLQFFRDNQSARLWRDEGRQQSPENRRVLILGCGDLGASIARLFKRFCCHTVGIRRHVSLAAPEGLDEVCGMDALNAQLAAADIVIGALPSTDETRGLLDYSRLSRMGRQTILINVGRGNLIDLNALDRLLGEGGIYGAAIDVTDPEPLPADHPLWQRPNCIITPHASGGSFGHLTQTEEKIYAICRENLKRYLNGEALLNELDFATGYRSAVNRY